MPPQPASPFGSDFYEPVPIRVAASDAPPTAAGQWPPRPFDDRIGPTAQFAAVLHDPRDPDRIDHTFPEMVRSRVFGILAGYADQNDHNTLRTDPVFKLLARHSPTNADLASHSDAVALREPERHPVPVPPPRHAHRPVLRLVRRTVRHAHL